MEGVLYDLWQLPSLKNDAEEASLQNYFHNWVFTFSEKSFILRERPGCPYSLVSFYNFR